MSTAISLRGVTYQIPGVGESAWGDQIAAYLVALASQCSALLIFGNSSSGTGSNTFYLRPSFVNATADGNELSMVMPQAGKLSRLQYRARSAHSGGNLVLTVRKNGADTALTATAASGDASASDTTNAVAVAQNDLVSVKFTTNSALGAAADMYAYLMFSPS